MIALMVAVVVLQVVLILHVRALCHLTRAASTGSQTVARASRERAHRLTLMKVGR